MSFGIIVPKLQDRANAYVEDFDHSNELTNTGEGLVIFGAVPAAGTTDLLVLTAFVAGARQTFATPILVDDNFGRTVNVVTSAAGVVTLFGRDYLNQPITQTITFGSGTTTATTKAFKYVDAMVCTTSINISLGRGPKLGLPFTVAIISQEFNGNAAAGGAGTVTAADATSPATATTGDPRGTYTTNTTMNGSNWIEARFRFSQRIGPGLYGVRQT